VTWGEIWNVVERGIIGPVIGLVLAFMLDVYRRVTSADTMKWYIELPHILALAALFAFCARGLGQSWSGIAYTLPVSVFVAHGWNGKWSFPSHAKKKHKQAEKKP